MATMYLENQQMAEDFVRGCTFMGTGLQTDCSP